MRVHVLTRGVIIAESHSFQWGFRWTPATLLRRALLSPHTQLWGVADILFVGLQPGRRMGGLFGRAKAAVKGAADEAQDLVDDAPQVGTLLHVSSARMSVCMQCRLASNKSTPVSLYIRT